MKDKVIAEFRRLFWAARLVHRKKSPSAEASSAAHKIAVAYARKHRLKWAENLLKASLLENQDKSEEALEVLGLTEKEIPATEKGYLWFLKGTALRTARVDDAIKAYNQAIKNSDFDKRGYAWLALGFALLGKGEYDEAIKAYRKALEDPKYDRPGYAWNGLGIALDEKGEYDEAIKAYYKALDDPKYDTPGSAWNNLGVALHDKGEYDEAMKAYHKALDDPEYDTPGSAWYNLGVALHDKGEYDEAIKAYRKALDDPKYDTPGRAWYGLGAALKKKGEYDEAIKAYRKALDDPKYDTPGRAWYGLGAALKKKGEYDEAIKAYRKALDDPKYDTPGIAWYGLGATLGEQSANDEAANAFRKALEDPKYDAPGNARHGLGVVLERQGKNEEAIEAYRNALEDPKFEKDEPWASRTRSVIALLESGLPKESLSSDDRALLESKPSMAKESTPEDPILDKMARAGKTQYQQYEERKDSERDDLFSILRGWSSSVPLLEGSERLCSGGGYFLKWRGKGIVIDPGFDFLHNFHDAGYHGREIHAVLVSHNHADHNADLKNIDHLRYELDSLYRQTGKKGLVPYSLIWDEETRLAVKFDVKKPKHQFKPVLFDTGRAETNRKIEALHELPFSVEYFPVKHSHEVPNAVGFRIHLIGGDGANFTIGYTGDTRFFEGLARDLAGCDLLVAHISQPSTRELLNPAARKKNHLGYRGLIELVKACKPRATLISEFWAGLTDLRIDLVQAIRKQTNNNAILPASIGMHVHLPSLEVECTQCAKPVTFEKVRVAPPANRFGNLSYLCESCMLGG